MQRPVSGRRKMVALGVFTVRLLAALLLVLLALPASTVDATSCPAPAPLKVMPIGDSLTVGQTDEASAPWQPEAWNGYRAQLWLDLRADGLDIDYVGDQQNGSSPLMDRDHEGHGGWSVAQVRDHVGGWVRDFEPDVILLQIGTPDMLTYPGQDNLTAAYWQLLVNIHQSDPDVWTLVSTIPPADGTLYTQPSAGTRADIFNAQLPAIVQGAAQAGYRVRLVNVGGRLPPSVLYDGIHPTAAGYQQLAEGWHAELLRLPVAPRMTGGFPAITWTALATAPTGYAVYDLDLNTNHYDLVMTVNGDTCTLLWPVAPSAGWHAAWVIAWNAQGWGQWSEGHVYCVACAATVARSPSPSPSPSPMH